MLSKTLRIGPLFLLEVFALIVGVMLRTVFQQRCWSLALMQCSLSIFLLQSLLAYHIIVRSKKHRREYLCGMAASPNSKLYPTLAWNQLVLLTVMVLFSVATADDLLRLMHSQRMQDCFFELYPLCLEYESELSSQKQVDSAQLWLLFVFYTLFNVFLMTFLQYKQYSYTLNILKNRRELARQYLGDDILLAGHTSEQVYEGKPNERPSGECSICLSEVVTGDIITYLECRHSFHSRCLKQWLDKRKQCPFRCSPNFPQVQ